MKLLLTALVLLLSVHSFARESHHDRREHDRRIDEGRREQSSVNIFEISNTLLITSFIDENKSDAIIIANDYDDYLQSGNLSALLVEKISEVQKNDQDLSLEDALDLVVASSVIKK
jgi:hypothetical protein